MINIAILGAGEIGQAVYRLLSSMMVEADTNTAIDQTSIDSNYPYRKITSVHIFDGSPQNANVRQLDFANFHDLAATLQDIHATHVINAGPFFLNDAIAKIASSSGCSYIDFTEDDIASNKVQEIYKDFPHLTCATKCGLAPGFINYVGYDLVSKIEKPESLVISVGALPRNVSYEKSSPEQSYALSWSIDGLVNEYIRPCQVRIKGKELLADALVGRKTLILDGIEYESAFTSGGIGSLIKDLPHVPNVHYSTIRYPGHYDYVIDAVKRNRKDFDRIKQEFLKVFPYTRDDIIVAYAEAVGHTKGKFVRESFASRYYSADPELTAIQSTTAAGGLAVLELMLQGKLTGIVSHSMVLLDIFRNTYAYKCGYIC